MGLPQRRRRRSRTSTWRASAARASACRTTSSAGPDFGVGAGHPPLHPHARARRATPERAVELQPLAARRRAGASTFRSGTWSRTSACTAATASSGSLDDGLWHAAAVTEHLDHRRRRRPAARRSTTTSTTSSRSASRRQAASSSSSGPPAAVADAGVTLPACAAPAQQAAYQQIGRQRGRSASPGSPTSASTCRNARVAMLETLRWIVPAVLPAAMAAASSCSAPDSRQGAPPARVVTFVLGARGGRCTSLPHVGWRRG